MFPFLARPLRSLAPLFRPPFDGLWIAILLYFFWCFLVHPQGQILRGNLPDPDDYMYLDQVLDWLKGQGWFDHIQHRLDPPAGGMIHFSRLPQIPMAALILLFELFGLKPYGAATLMAIIEPLFLLAGFFAAIRWVAASFMPKEWAGITAYIALFATGLMALFAPGHIDHHGLVVLLVALALGCTARMMWQPDDTRWALGAGFMLALALTVALEVLPWLIVMSVWIGLWTMIEGRAAARSGLAYGLALYLASGAFLTITRAPVDLLTPDVAAYSIVYIFFTGSIAAIFAGIALAARERAAWRWVLGTGITAVTGVMFLSHFPSLTTGPWGGVNAALARLILENVNEAIPLAKIKGGSWFLTILAVLESLIALAANLCFLRRARSLDFWLWSLMAALLTTALLLTVFYQYRFVGALGLFAVVPLAALLQRGWQWIGARERGRRKVFAEIGLLLLVGPLPAVLLPALIDGRSFNAGVLLFPVHGSSQVCDMYGLERILRTPQLYGGKPRLIMNTMGLGPELLFRTPHMVVSAPYHEDVTGNLDAVRFFSATDPAKAEAIARRRHVDLVVACFVIPGMYTDLAKIKKVLPDDGGGSPSVKPAPPLILRLITGQQLPGWLKPIQSPILRNYAVYEVAPRRSATTSTKRE